MSFDLSSRKKEEAEEKKKKEKIDHRVLISDSVKFRHISIGRFYDSQRTPMRIRTPNRASQSGVSASSGRNREPGRCFPQPWRRSVTEGREKARWEKAGSVSLLGCAIATIIVHKHRRPYLWPMIGVVTSFRHRLSSSSMPGLTQWSPSPARGEKRKANSHVANPRQTNRPLARNVRTSRVYIYTV